MKNAHLRFGWLRYVKATEKATTNIRLRLDRFFGELLPEPPRQAKAHLISVIGSDTQIAAINAAISMGDPFIVEAPGVPPVRVCLEGNAQVYKGALQLSGRKKPLRHLIGLSEEIVGANCPATSGKTLLVCSEAQFVWSATAHIHGIPGMPEWDGWFAGELKTHRAIVPALGVGCSPAVIKGTKEQFLDWLSWGVESEAVRLPHELSPIHWPIFRLRDIFWPSA
jgi:hypothetical protein